MQSLDATGALATFWRRRIGLLLTVWCFAATTAFAQVVPPKEKPKGPPPPEDVSFDSKDGVSVKATYWEPEEPGKETIPIILIHGWEGNRKEFDLLGKFLQSLGHAVISVDLRGHGGSTTLKRPNAAADVEIKPDKMTRPAFEAMVYDVQAAKDFLFDKHVEGKLNLNQLCVIGADMGAVVALNFAYYDWTRPVYPSKIFKVGQDVQALVLLSPPTTSEKGLTAKNAIAHPIVSGRISTLIVVGGNGRTAASDARKLNGIMAGKHAKVSGEDAAEKQDLFFKVLDTELQGTKLLVRGLDVDKLIGEFIKLRLVNKADDQPWTEREKPR